MILIGSDFVGLKIAFEALNSIESFVTIGNTLNFLISFSKAIIRSVSLIFNVWSPINLQDIFNARQVTAIVWAKSGFAERSRFIIFSDLAIFSNELIHPKMWFLHQIAQRSYSHFYPPEYYSF